MDRQARPPAPSEIRTIKTARAAEMKQARRPRSGLGTGLPRDITISVGTGELVPVYTTIPYQCKRRVAKIRSCRGFGSVSVRGTGEIHKVPTYLD